MSDLKKIPLAIKALLLNPTYMFISVGAAADGLVIAGLSAFLPKFIQSQYKFTASLSSGIVGKSNVKFQVSSFTLAVSISNIALYH